MTCPGLRFPERYFAYLRSRQAGLLRVVVEHNRQDIVSMARMLSVICLRSGRTPEAWPQAHPGDLFGLGRGFCAASPA